jgi:hypothetical protein
LVHRSSNQFEYFSGKAPLACYCLLKQQPEG